MTFEYSVLDKTLPVLDKNFSVLDKNRTIAAKKSNGQFSMQNSLKNKCLQTSEYLLSHIGFLCPDVRLYQFINLTCSNLWKQFLNLNCHSFTRLFRRSALNRIFYRE